MATDSGMSITPGPRAVVAHRTLRGIRNQGAEPLQGRPDCAPIPLHPPCTQRDPVSAHGPQRGLQRGALGSRPPVLGMPPSFRPQMFRPDAGASPQGCKDLSTLFNKHLLGVPRGRATQGTPGNWGSPAQPRLREVDWRKQTLEGETSRACQKWGGQPHTKEPAGAKALGKLRPQLPLHSIRWGSLGAAAGHCGRQGDPQGSTFTPVTAASVHPCCPVPGG